MKNLCAALTAAALALFPCLASGAVNLVHNGNFTSVSPGTGTLAPHYNVYVESWTVGGGSEAFLQVLTPAEAAQNEWSPYYGISKSPSEIIRFTDKAF